MAAECTRYRPHPLCCNGWLPLFQYLQGLDEEQQPSVRFKQRSIGQEEEGQGRSQGRGEDSEEGGSVYAHGGSNTVSTGIVAKFNFRCA